MTAPTLADRHRERAEKFIGTWLRDRNPKGLTQRCAEALAAVERETIERCAEVCEQEAREHAKLHDPHLEDVAYSCAALVRALADRKEG
jgi:Fe-S-cluster-containing dehydrogenase component